MSEIPIDFLANCSTQSLEDTMLNSENEAANHRKGVRMEIDELIQAAVRAEFARWMLKHRDEIRKALELQVQVLDGRSTGRGVAEELCLIGDKNDGNGSTEKGSK